MYAKNTTIGELEQALQKTNEIFDGNVIWNRQPEWKGNQLHFTLRVRNSHNKGARRGVSGKCMISACWHVHGVFFDQLLDLNENVIIRTATAIIDIDDGNWVDQEIGSQVQPLRYSEACDCNPMENYFLIGNSDGYIDHGKVISLK